MKVIASSLRKGNVVEMDGKLYVVLTAQNFHPGKGTPVTQVDMRRISDGTKVSERWRTTEQVERAHVDDHLPGAHALAVELAEDADIQSGAGVVITGSVVTAGEARTLFGKDPA